MSVIQTASQEAISVPQRFTPMPSPQTSPPWHQCCCHCYTRQVVDSGVSTSSVPQNNPQQNPPQHGASDLKYELPPTVASVREGWQWTCSSGAVVSGLLAAAAAQLLSIFKGTTPLGGNVVLGLCYAALFLNISATIGSFTITDTLGEIHFRASKKKDHIGFYDGPHYMLLRKYGANCGWTFMLWHWLITFYLGILALTLAVLIYVWKKEVLAISAAMTCIVTFTLIPVTVFIFGSEFFNRKE